MKDINTVRCRSSKNIDNNVRIMNFRGEGISIQVKTSQHRQGEVFKIVDNETSSYASWSPSPQSISDRFNSFRSSPKRYHFYNKHQIETLMLNRRSFISIRFPTQWERYEERFAALSEIKKSDLQRGKTSFQVNLYYYRDLITTWVSFIVAIALGETKSVLSWRRR